MKKRFLEYLLEDNNEELNEAGANADPKKNDCHEILTAYLCTRKIADLEALEKVTGADNILKELQAIYDDVKNSNKIIGASESDIESIIQYNKKEEALAQAISAAKAILQQKIQNETELTEDDVERPISETSEGVSNVILTGKSWDKLISKYSGIENLNQLGVDSCGMKDFNSSDIVLVSKNKTFLGVSLKKKDIKPSAGDPTLINRAFNETLPAKANTAVNSALDECFTDIVKSKNLILSDDILPAILEKLPKMKKKNGSVSETYSKFISGSQIDEITGSKAPEKALEKFLKDKCKNAKGDDWRLLLSSTFGLMCTHNNRVEIRKVINPELSKPSSKYKQSITAVLKDAKIAENIAYQLFRIIFKADKETGLMVLKKYNFDFGLCTGIGAYQKKNQSLKVGKAEYESIQTVTKILSELRKVGKPVLDPAENGKDAIYADKEDNTAVTLFYVLKLGKFPIANISIRYKGQYTSAPNFLATISKELKEKLLANH